VLVPLGSPPGPLVELSVVGGCSVGGPLDPCREDKVYRVKKALCGLKQALRVWYSRINNYIHNHVFVKCSSESVVYKNIVGSDFTILCLYVDDLIFMGTSFSLVKEFREEMKSKFEMFNLGEVQYF